jgi:uncharacterized oligopeptide transporter (OPT) family protein
LYTDVERSSLHIKDISDPLDGNNDNPVTSPDIDLVIVTVIVTVVVNEFFVKSQAIVAITSILSSLSTFISICSNISLIIRFLELALSIVRIEIPDTLI